jgi:hypothetical protein
VSYINVDLDYFDHPKTKRLVGLLGVGAELLPIRLWAYTGKYHPRTGIITGYAPQEVEIFVGWKGKPGKMVAALLKVGFVELVGTPKCLKIHDWKTTQGHLWSLKIRNKKIALSRWEKLRRTMEERKSTVDTSGTNLVCQDPNPGMPPGPGPAQAQPIPKHKPEPRPSQEPGTETARVVASDKTEGRPGICDYRYQDGARCSADREPGAIFCRHHIEKRREEKAGGKRVGGWKSSAEIAEEGFRIPGQ